METNDSTVSRHNAASHTGAVAVALPISLFLPDQNLHGSRNGDADIVSLGDADIVSVTCSDAVALSRAVAHADTRPVLVPVADTVALPNDEAESVTDTDSRNCSYCNAFTPADDRTVSCANVAAKRTSYALP